MKKIIKPIILVFILSIYLINGCGVRSTKQMEEPDMPYTFSAESTTDNLPSGGQICSIIENFDKDYMNNCALIYGKLKTLFGEPLYETEDNENLYSYCIRAESETGSVVYLEVYSGSSGPAIGGDSVNGQDAAKVLVDYIWQAEASDYECKSYYMDTLSEITMGVRDGIPYYEETVHDLTPEEYDALFNHVYGLDE